MNQRPLCYEGKRQATGAASPTNSICVGRYAGTRLGLVGAAWQAFTEKTRTTLVGFPCACRRLASEPHPPPRPRPRVTASVARGRQSAPSPQDAVSCRTPLAARTGQRASRVLLVGFPKWAVPKETLMAPEDSPYRRSGSRRPPGRSRCPRRAQLRLAQAPTICFAPQYVAEELLRAEGH